MPVVPDEVVNADEQSQLTQHIQGLLAPPTPSDSLTNPLGPDGPDQGGGGSPSPSLAPSVVAPDSGSDSTAAGPASTPSSQPAPDAPVTAPLVAPTSASADTSPTAPVTAPLNPPTADATGYVFPVTGWTGGKVQDHWGEVPGGADLMAKRGTPVVAMRGGQVIESGWNSVGGNSVLVQGTDGNQYYYAHLDAKPSVTVGQSVDAGTYLGPVGNTGDADKGPTHLHIGIGPSILLGADKYGGTGGSFNAVGLLQHTLDGTSATTGATGSAAPPVQSGQASYSPFDDVFRKYAGDLANDPRFISIVAAGTKAESGWNADNTTGDGGHSWGLFQMHDHGAGAGMGNARLDPNAASAVMVPQYAAAYRQITAQNPGLSGPALAAQVAQAAERSADPTGATYAAAYRSIMGGDTAAPSVGTSQQAAPSQSGASTSPSLLDQFGSHVSTLTNGAIDLGTQAANTVSQDAQPVINGVSDFADHVKTVTGGLVDLAGQGTQILGDTAANAADAAGNALPTFNPSLPANSPVAQQAAGNPQNPFAVKDQAVSGLADQLMPGEGPVPVAKGALTGLLDPANLPGGAVAAPFQLATDAAAPFVRAGVGALANKAIDVGAGALDRFNPPEIAAASTSGGGDVAARARQARAAIDNATEARLSGGNSQGQAPAEPAPAVSSGAADAPPPYQYDPATGEQVYPNALSPANPSTTGTSPVPVLADANPPLSKLTTEVGPSQLPIPPGFGEAPRYNADGTAANPAGQAVLDRPSLKSSVSDTVDVPADVATDPTFPQIRPVKPSEVLKLFTTGNIISSGATLAHVLIGAIERPAWTLLRDTGRSLVTGSSEAIGPEWVAAGASLADAFLDAGRTMVFGRGVGQSGFATISDRIQGSRPDQLIGKGLAKVWETPGNLHGGLQQFAQTIVQGAETGRLAAIEATNQGFRPNSPQWTAAVDALRENPPAAIAKAAEAAGLRAGTRAPLGALSSKANDAINAAGPVGKAIQPIFTTPARAGAMHIEASPLGLVGTLLDLPGYARGTVNPDATPLGERLGNNVLGTAATAALVFKALDGNITGDGPQDPQARAELLKTGSGWQPNSVRVPGIGYMDYNSLGDLALPLRLAGNIADMKRDAVTGMNTQSVMGDAAQRLLSYASTLPGLQTMADAATVMKGGPQAQSTIAFYMASAPERLIPGSAILGNVATATDPTQRAPAKGTIPQRALTDIEHRIPGLREQTPPAVGPDGRPVRNPNQGLAAFLPRVGADSIPGSATIRAPGGPAKYVGVSAAQEPAVDDARARVAAYRTDPIHNPAPKPYDYVLAAHTINPQWTASNKTSKQATAGHTAAVVRAFSPSAP